MRALARLLLLLSALLVPALPAHAAGDHAVTVVKLSGGIDPAYADYLERELRGAAERHDVAVVLHLRSGGSVEVDVPELLAAVCASPVPVVAWVGPHDVVAAGAATALWLAADVGLVAPGAEIRSAVPLQRGGSRTPFAMPCRRTSARSDALAGELLRPGRRATADELLASGLATAPAGTIVEAVRALETVEVDGHRLDLDPAAATIRFANPGLVARSRQALATNPTLVYLLLLAGLGALVFEAVQPGFGPAGYAGLLLVALAAYGLVALPTDPLGLAVLLLGVGGMAWDVRRDALGLPTWAGAVALAAGSWLLVRSDGPALRVPLAAIAVGVLGSVVFYVVGMTVAVRALRGPAADGGRSLLGRIGEVRSTLNPHGHVLVDGALWRARALEWDGAVPAGTQVTVTAVDADALVLDVTPSLS